MLRYGLAALALKTFSIGDVSKKIYRWVGNAYGSKQRGKANIESYVDRGNLLVDLCRKYRAIKEGDELLEIGTGWMHWYSLYLRLFYNVSITMLDIWDNRQFTALKSSFSKLEKMSEQLPRNDKVAESLHRIISANDFERLYRDLWLKYVIDERGSLDQFPENSFNSISAFTFLNTFHEKIPWN